MVHKYLRRTRFALSAKYHQRNIETLTCCTQGVVYPGIHAVWSRWAPPAERTRLGSFAFSGSFVGTVIGYPLCGWLAEKYGWPSTFYVPGKLK